MQHTTFIPTFIHKIRLAATALVMAAVLVAAVLVTWPGMAAESAPQGSVSMELSIEAQPIGSALTQFAKEFGKQIVVYDEDAASIKSKALEGSYTLEAALEFLLKGSGLTYKYINGRTIAVGTPERLSEMENRGSDEEEEEEKERAIEEMTVTGSHIRGAVPVGSPLVVINRQQIEIAGYSTAKDLLETLPQNFGGGANEETSAISGTPGSQSSGGIGINLRGLGVGATLTLINGRRMAQGGGTLGSFTDVASIPVSAIERVEILPDGASAIYGSDAIAGVVNFVLRKDYQGAETRLHFGDSTDGGGEEFQLGQSFGKNWATGNALFSYEYYNRDNLQAADRSYTASTDLRPFGGDDFRLTRSSPGTIVSPSLAAIPSGQDGTNLTSADLLAGQSNLYNDAQGNDILPHQKKQNAHLMVRQTIGENLEFFAELGYAKREVERGLGYERLGGIRVNSTHPYFVSPDPAATEISVDYSFINDRDARVSTADVDNINAALGAVYDIGSDWQLEIYGSSVEEETESFGGFLASIGRLAETLGFDDPATPYDPNVDGYFNIFGDGGNTPSNVIDYIFSGGQGLTMTGDVQAANVRADGSLFEMSGGAVKLAAGSNYRSESFERDERVFGNDTVSQGSFVAVGDRDVFSVFGELYLPLFSDQNRRNGLEKLALSAAVRYEDYSDFGTSTNPKFGVMWSPLVGLALRGSWGTSFRAPIITNMIPDEFPQSASWNFYEAPPAGSPNPIGIVRFGNNPDLGAETSTAWTVGLDIDPPSIPGLDIDLTYYNIFFEDRIGLIPGFQNVFFEPELFAPIVELDPAAAVALATELMMSPAFRNSAGIADPSEVTYVLDVRQNNLAITDVSGLDATLNFGTDTSAGRFDFSLNGSYILEFKNQVSINSQAFDNIGEIGFPTALNLRGSASWTRSAYGATLFVNHTDSYRDTTSDPERTVKSWTTADLSLRYDGGEAKASGALQNMVFSLNVQNIFDSDPPFVNQRSGGYDPANADARGRFVGFTTTWKWW